MIKVIDSNVILIAEFMEWTIDQGGVYLPSNFDPAGSERCGMWFAFDEVPIEWNLLMLIVEKIEAIKPSEIKKMKLKHRLEDKVKIYLQKENDIIGFWISNGSGSFVPDGLSNTCNSPKYSKRQPFFEVLLTLIIEFINWYNKNKS
jgi:hypothetical protein